MTIGRDIPITNEIKLFFHCGLCLEELTKRVQDTGQSVSPREYSQLEIGWTTLGIQAWCRRHDVNVLHVDFQGQKHPANTTRPK